MERKILLPVDIRCPNKETSKLKWLAIQTPAVIELSKDLYRQIRPFCTDKSCRKMTAGKYEYQWKHHPRSKKPRSYPAQYYLKMMFQWLNQQKHIFELETMRHERLVRHLGEDLDDNLHPLFRKDAIKVLIVDYLHDPFYYLTGIWAKAFSVFAHVFCQHFGNDELTPEVKAHIELSFERFMRFVKGYKILSNRRLAPLDKRIATLDFKNLPETSPITTSPPRESKSVVSKVILKDNRTSVAVPSVIKTESVVRLDDSTKGAILDGEKKETRSTNPLTDKKENPSTVETNHTLSDKKDEKQSVPLTIQQQLAVSATSDGDKDGYASDPEQLTGNVSGGDDDNDELDFRARGATKSSGGLDTSARLEMFRDRADSGGADREGDDQPGSKEKAPT